MKSLTAALLLVSVVCVSNIALAKDLKNESANFTVDIPDNSWVERSRGEVLGLEHRDSTMMIELIGHPDTDFDGHAEGFDTGKATAFVAKSLGNVKLSGKVHSNTINGMPCVEYDGTAKDARGRNTLFAATTCKTGTRKGMTAVMFATEDGFKRHKDTALTVVRSVKPLH